MSISTSYPCEYSHQVLLWTYTTEQTLAPQTLLFFLMWVFFFGGGATTRAVLGNILVIGAILEQKAALG